VTRPRLANPIGREFLLACTVCGLLSLPAPGGPAPPDVFTTLETDIPADLPPLLCGDTAWILSRKGRIGLAEQGASKTEELSPLAPPAVEPICAGKGIVWIDGAGDSWHVGKGGRTLVEQGLTEVLFLKGTPEGAVLLFRDRLRLADGSDLRLPIAAEGLTVLAGGSLWVYGEEAGAFVESEGAIRWVWRPGDLRPGPAAASKDRIFVATKDGALVSLVRRSGKERYRFSCGAAIVSAPVCLEGRVIFASRDHLVRALSAKGGTVLWQRRLEGRPDFGPYEVPGGIAFLESVGNRLIVLSPEAGKRSWSWTAPEGVFLQPPAFQGAGAVLIAWGESAVPHLYRIDIPPQSKVADESSRKAEAAP